MAGYFKLRRPETVTLSRKVERADEFGGVTQTEGPVGTYQVDVEDQSLTDQQRTPGAPGTVTRQTKVFVFIPPYPAVRINDWLTRGDGTRYEVKFIFPLSWTMQVFAWSLT